MQKLFNFFKKHLFLFLILLVSIPSFYRMVRPGIYSTQDFHFFRLVEFDKCVRNLQIPCRWAPDAGLGYGEPLFNFYGQLGYAAGEVFHLIGFQKIDALKILFALSLVGSALSMFYLARSVWKDSLAAFFSSVLYLYAPYRAVDVWVRGALPEALSFILFPLITLKITEYIKNEKKKDLIWFGVLLALLILTHNLSFVLFAPFLVIWTLLKLYQSRKFHLLTKIAGSLVISFLISGFYVLPVLFESKFIDLASTTRGYFDFRGHFLGIKQIFLDRSWGYGASVFGSEDGLNLSVGILQWAVPFLGLILFIVKKEIFKHKDFIVLFAFGLLTLFLTHNKSSFIWESLGPLSFIQFPWRFLGVAVFVFALAGGTLVNSFMKQRKLITILLTLTVIGLTFPYFKEDIWQNVVDNDLLTGENWEIQKGASIGDYWPKFGGQIPSEAAPLNPKDGILLEKTSNKITYKINIEKEETLEFPVNFFPGWVGESEGKSLDAFPSSQGLLSASITPGEKEITFKFRDTNIRRLGNLLSLVGIGLVLILLK